MGSSFCPHLVQEYFERVSDIVITYRSQILQQVEYDKISENLVVRGAVRQEEHEKIYQYDDVESQVNQMLVVIQNRMWGLENFLAALMEEHVSTWLTQAMFRAYMDHLVQPMRKLWESPPCQCVHMSSSIVYRGWVKALKSIDTWILNTGNSLGFLRQTMYPADNMLGFLSEKLAELTGGDSSSAKSDDLIPYGFSANAAGDVQVAELEEDDIQDLISLSEASFPSIAYPSKEDLPAGREAFHSEEGQASTSPGVISKDNENVDDVFSSVKTRVVIAKPVTRNILPQRSEGAPTPISRIRHRRSIDETSTLQTRDASLNNEKLVRQQQLIDRLSAPKSATSRNPSASSGANAPVVRLRNRNSSLASDVRQRPRSAEFSRSVSIPVSSSASPPISTFSPADDTNPLTTSPKLANRPKTGKTSGFVKSKSVIASGDSTSDQPSGQNLRHAKPTAVAKPNMKVEDGKIGREISSSNSGAKKKFPNEKSHETNTEDEMVKSLHETEFLKRIEKPGTQNTVVPEDLTNTSHPERFSQSEEDLFMDVASAEIASKFLINFASPERQHDRSKAFYHLSFDRDWSDDD